MKTKTPICDFAEKYSAQKYARFHMPGHKGNGFLGCETVDITEINGADSLYEANGIIAQSERIAAELYGTGATFYSAEGSSLCIRAMLYLVKLQAENNGRKPFILATRNAHKVFALTVALLDIDVMWLNGYDRATLCDCRVKPEDLDETLAKLERLPDAVFITSPDYLGNIANIQDLSATAHKHGCLFVCDNAHGAYLKFISGNLHPIDNGCDMCCDSAHKTLPCLTGGAYLHINKKAPIFLKENARDALAMFGSTSPSYLILQSLDKANGLLFDGYGIKIKQTAERVNTLKSEIENAGWTLLKTNEPLKITFDCKENGYDGRDFAKLLIKNGIMPEYEETDYVVLMISPENSNHDFTVLLDTLKNLPLKQKKKKETFSFIPKTAMPMKQALETPSEYVDINESLGRIVACPTVSCPPAVPIVYGGELIDRRAVTLFEYYGITKVKVIKQIKDC